MGNLKSDKERVYTNNICLRVKEIDNLKYKVDVSINDKIFLFSFIFIPDKRILPNLLNQQSCFEVGEGKTSMPVFLQKEACSFMRNKFDIKIEQILEVENEN